MTDKTLEERARKWADEYYAEVTKDEMDDIEQCFATAFLAGYQEAVGDYGGDPE